MKREQGVLKERVVAVPKLAMGAQSLYELMHQTLITCHGGGSEHQASICLECERYAGCRISADKGLLAVRCWWYGNGNGCPVVELRDEEPRRWARGTLVPAMQCDSCGEYGGYPHPRMPSVNICEDCMDLSLVPVDYAEIGAAD